MALGIWKVEDRDSYFAVTHNGRLVSAGNTRRIAMANLKKMKKDYKNRYVHVKGTSKRKAHVRAYPKSGSW